MFIVWCVVAKHTEWVSFVVCVRLPPFWKRKFFVENDNEWVCERTKQSTYMHSNSREKNTKQTIESAFACICLRVCEFIVVQQICLPDYHCICVPLYWFGVWCCVLHWKHDKEIERKSARLNIQKWRCIVRCRIHTRTPIQSHQSDDDNFSNIQWIYQPSQKIFSIKCI